MSTQQNFRSAFNGFNREDVVHYIEYINAKHASEIAQLNSELEFLRGSANAAPEVDPALEQQAARIRELFDRCRELEDKLEQVTGEKEALARQLEAAGAQQSACGSRTDEELEAYRRAERTERMARERAELLYNQTNGALADATAKVDEAAGQIGQLTDRAITQLTELQTAIAGSKQALQDAAAAMYAIQPKA